MDSKTHLEVSARLMAAMGAPREAAIAALFPQVDREPPTLHRLHAHNLARARPITSMGLWALFDGPPQPSDAYELRRFRDETPRFRAYLDGQLDARGALQADALEPALLSYVSHLWLDTFNQPVQPFAPWNIYCSGQWTLWQQLGDFRKTLYTTDAIDRLRAAIFAEPVWSALPGHSIAALLEAMLRRLCALSRDDLPPALAVQGMQALGLAREPSARVEAAVKWLEVVEERIRERHLECLGTRGAGSTEGVSSRGAGVVAPAR